MSHTGTDQQLASPSNVPGHQGSVMANILGHVSVCVFGDPVSMFGHGG